MAARRQVPARPPPAARRPARPPVGALVLPYDYVARTRSLPVNLLFLVPFVLVYELALLGTRSPVENAAAAWLRALWHALGPAGTAAASLGLTCVFLLVVCLRARQATGERGLYGGMLLEGTVYGLSLGFVAQLLASSMPMGRTVPLAALGVAGGEGVARLSTDLREVGLAIGAGVFEELVFRGLLLAGLVATLRHALTADRLTSGLVALLLSSYLFAAYHHWGAFGEPYHPAVFAFRFHAGVLLGALFLTRGLGIAALAHGVYDLWVTLG